MASSPKKTQANLEFHNRRGAPNTKADAARHPTATIAEFGGVFLSLDSPSRMRNSNDNRDDIHRCGDNSSTRRSLDNRLRQKTTAPLMISMGIPRCLGQVSAMTSLHLRRKRWPNLRGVVERPAPTQAKSPEEGKAALPTRGRGPCL